jgi:peptidase M28-like protein
MTRTFLFLYVLSALAWAQPHKADTPAAGSASASAARGRLPKLCPACIRAHEEFLASDAMNGRGSGTHDELVAATYIAAQLRQYGIAPAGDDGGYIQRVPLVRRKFSKAPELRFMTPGDGIPAEEITFTHGNEALFLQVGAPELSGLLQKVVLKAEPAPAIQPGAFVFLKAAAGANPPTEDDAQRAVKAGAAVVLLSENPHARAHWKTISERLFDESLELAGDSGGNVEGHTILRLSEEATKRLDEMPDGTRMKVIAPAEKLEKAFTWNVLGEIKGRDRGLKAAVLLSAHYDHVGVGEPVNGDSIYNGADDDASGTTAVLELARVLSFGPTPRRTVIFALFGSEELGGVGSTYFRQHPIMPLADIAANLEFEMIGRADPAVAPGTLWLTGWERSNLGPTLAAHGAHLVRDPHPQQNFFERSDNFFLAQKGVVAQTISSYGLHKDYHQPSDDISHLDFKHMNEAIQSLLGPVEWLVNSDFRPEWKAGKKP